MTTEKTCNQWLKKMKAAGFYGKFTATSGDGVVIRGEIKKSGELTTQQQTSAN